MRSTIIAAAAAALLLATADGAHAQEKGNARQKERAAQPAKKGGADRAAGRGADKAHGKPAQADRSRGQQKPEGRGRPDKDGGRPEARDAKGRKAPAEPAAMARGVRGADALSGRAGNERLVAGALGKRRARGHADDDLDVILVGDRVRVLDDGGRVLVDLDDGAAQRLGRWEVARVRERSNAPAFCRSGDGHPVWGREWCARKGFGSGGGDGWTWGRAPVDDVVYREPRYDIARVGRDVLAAVLGDIVFGRLALHSLTLGAREPLSGIWFVPETGPRILRIHAGDLQVAELVDLDRDDEVDVLFVAVADD